MPQRIVDEPIIISKATTSNMTIVQENACHHVIMPSERQRHYAVQDAPTSRHMASSTTRTHTGKQVARRQACTKAYTKTAIRLPARQQQSIMSNTPKTRCNSVHAAAHIAKRQADTRPTPDSPTASKHAAKQHVQQHAQHAACLQLKTMHTRSTLTAGTKTTIRKRQARQQAIMQ